MAQCLMNSHLIVKDQFHWPLLDSHEPVHLYNEMALSRLKKMSEQVMMNVDQQYWASGTVTCSNLAKVNKIRIFQYWL